jgi:Escherichia/Staphylococcus phage prohead protease
VTTTEQAAETRYAKRTYAVELSAGDGRTVDLRIAPYGERIRANDGLGFLPPGEVYVEEIMPGAFDAQLNAAHRVLANVEHEPGIAGVVARGVALRSAPDGFYGSFTCLETQNGDTALELVKAGALGGASFEAKFLHSVRSAEGVVQRVRARLRNVAFCRDPAYTGALILGVREADDELETMIEETSLPIPFDPELAERIERLGIAVPSRLKSGHLEPDTSPAGDTSESTPPSQ